MVNHCKCIYQNMCLTIIFFSMNGSCLAGLFGRYLGSQGFLAIMMFCLLLFFCLSPFAFYNVVVVFCFVYVKLFVWISLALVSVRWVFLFNSLTTIMCVVVTFIVLLVYLYLTAEYMLHDPYLPKFMSYLFLFIFFMLILLTVDNFIQMFVNWESVSLCSYFLINFWFTKIQENKVAIKAMVLNRIGDFCLFINMLLLNVNFKALDYSTLSVIMFLIVFYIYKIYYRRDFFSVFVWYNIKKT